MDGRKDVPSLALRIFWREEAPPPHGPPLPRGCLRGSSQVGWVRKYPCAWEQAYM
jgi:hypothetical protein